MDSPEILATLCSKDTKQRQKKITQEVNDIGHSMLIIEAKNTLGPET